MVYCFTMLIINHNILEISATLGSIVNSNEDKKLIPRQRIISKLPCRLELAIHAGLEEG